MTLKDGLLLYEARDAEKNSTFIAWLISEARASGLCLTYMSYEDWLTKGMTRDKLDRLHFVINRTRDDVLALNLELSGLRVFNNAEVTKVGNHKLWAYHFARAHHFPYLPIVLRNMTSNEGVISKPVDGHGGEGIFVFDNCRGAKNQWDSLSYSEKKKMLMQKELSHITGDVRCYVIGGEITHCVLRKKTEHMLVTNYTKGADIEIHTLSEQMKQQIEAFIAPLNIDYAGVDFLMDDMGKYYFNEIEDVVGSRMLSALNVNDTVPRFVAHIKRNL